MKQTDGVNPVRYNSLPGLPFPVEPYALPVKGNFDTNLVVPQRAFKARSPLIDDMSQDAACEWQTKFPWPCEIIPVEPPACSMATTDDICTAL